VAVFGLPQTALYAGGVVVSVEAIWLEYFRPGNGPRAFLTLWWHSLSSFATMALLHCWWVIGPFQMKYYLPSIAVFVVSHFVRYQVGAMNNSKVFFVGWFVVAVVCVAEVIAKLWMSGWVGIRIIAVVLLVEMTAASVCCFVRTLSSPIQIVTVGGIEYANWVTENVPIDAIAITDLHGFSPFCVLAGRMSFLSFIGWPGSQGIDVGKRVNVTKQFVTQNTKPGVFQELGITYAEEWQEKVVNLTRYDVNWNIVFQNDLYTLWEFLPPTF
jgi:hypothetical protein